MKLRSYQKNIFDKLLNSDQNDLVQLDTGGGKTPIEAALAEHYPFVILVAHRNILIGQLSEKMAAFGLRHDTISTEHTRRRCMARHRAHGKNYIQRGNRQKLVASIGSLISHAHLGRLEIDTTLPWVIVIDEAHHVLPENQWGKLLEIFPAARCIGFTATPARADGESLHVSNGGIFDRLIQANGLDDTSVRTLMREGYLSDFVAYAPMGNTNWQMCGLAKNDMVIAGDPIADYKRLASGTQAIAMCPSILNANLLADEFKAAGVSAACISSMMGAADVDRVVDAFVSKKVSVLCNVDMVGEGFDVPGVETLIMLRRTKSFTAYRQWVGRILRPSPGKKRGIIIDHVGNILGEDGHGMPDDPITWDIVSPPKSPARSRHLRCPKCDMVYPVVELRCPKCGTANPLLDRPTVGGYIVNFKQIDAELIKTVRQFKQAQDMEARLTQEIVWPAGAIFPGADAISRLCNELLRWLIESVTAAGVSKVSINQFIRSPEAKSPAWWIERFTVLDINNNRRTKAEKAFKSWQKSNSSTAKQKRPARTQNSSSPTRPST
jgi:superfamily II DNA or RNA helicase